MLHLLLFVYRKPIPDMSRQRGTLERENLKVHMCNGVFEAYSAAYLTTKEHMVAGKLPIRLSF
jgi:hypothetical protein